MTPQIIFIVWCVLRMAFGLSDNGKERKVDAGSTLIFLCWFNALMIWGGWYAPIFRRLSGQ